MGFAMRLSALVAAFAIFAAASIGFAEKALALTERQCLDYVRDQAATMYRVPFSNVDVKWYGPRLTELMTQLPKLAPDAKVSLGSSLYKLYGTMPVPLQVWNKGVKVATIYPRFQINVVQEVVVTVGRVPRGAMLDAGSVNVEKRPVATIMSQPFTSLSGVLGTIAKRDIQPGTILGASMIESPAVVKSGSVVSVRLVSGGLTVFGSGQALQDGRQGQLVRVLNTQSKRDFLGRVAGPDLVEIRLEEGDE